MRSARVPNFHSVFLVAGMYQPSLGEKATAVTVFSQRAQERSAAGIPNLDLLASEHLLTVGCKDETARNLMDYCTISDRTTLLH